MSEIVLFGCTHCHKLESGTDRNGPLYGECGVYPGCMKRLYTADEMREQTAAVVRATQRDSPVR